MTKRPREFRIQAEIQVRPRVIDDFVQAEAVIAARQKIVHGAVSMVEMALRELKDKSVVNLDDDRKAAMVSNLMVVLCGESEVHPIINTGTLYT